MKPRSLILILLIVLLPLTLLSIAGVRMAQNEEKILQQRFQRLMEDRLHDVNRVITRFFSETERELQRATSIRQFDADSIREKLRREPRVLQFFVIDSKGELVYPNLMGPLNSVERSFLLRSSGMFSNGNLLNAVIQEEKTNRQRSSESTNRVISQEDLSENWARVAEPRVRVLSEDSRTVGNNEFSRGLTGASGWFVWYWDRGLNLIYWQRTASGHVVGAALERSRWIADLIAELPETLSEPESMSVLSSVNSQTRLLDSGSELIYQWGSLNSSDAPELQKEDAPFCEIPVSAPLGSWRLQCFISGNQLTAGTGWGVWVGLAGGMLAASLAITTLGWLLYRDYARDMREAAQQISFVNQVSHELKTPLTNIRLYADLLENDLEERDQSNHSRAVQRLSVITSEAQRLTRLIANVLTFARQQRRSLQPRCRLLNLNELVSQIVERFRPSLCRNGIATDVQQELMPEVWLDADFVEQILGNLISNVEKYAAAGGRLLIRTRLHLPSQLSRSGVLSIDVIDAGPGIPVNQQKDLFRPFSRLSSDVCSAGGTGIGLSIAREMARLHGGDLILQPSEQGCHFIVTLSVQES